LVQMLQSVFCRIVLHLRKKNEYEIVKGHPKLQNVQVITVYIHITRYSKNKKTVVNLFL